MSSLRIAFAALLAVSYLTASMLPCEPAVARERGAAALASGALGNDVAGTEGHAHGGEHGDHTAAEEHVSANADEAMPCHEEPPALLPRCSCGCDERGQASTPGAKLGFALRGAEEDGAAILAPTVVTPLASRRHVQPSTGRDPIPI